MAAQTDQLEFDGPRIIWPYDTDFLRIPMSREEYLALPEDGDAPKVEWANGEAIMIRPRVGHSAAQVALATILNNAFPEQLVLMEAGLDILGNNRFPDLMVIKDADFDVEFITDVPSLVVEILSPSTWRNYLVDKSDEYARFGVPQYWIVDPDVAEITVWSNENGAWRTTAKLNADTPELDVAVGEFGTVTLRRDEVFRKRR